jgi:hypothetical protein
MQGCSPGNDILVPGRRSAQMGRCPPKEVIRGSGRWICLYSTSGRTPLLCALVESWSILIYTWPENRMSFTVVTLIQFNSGGLTPPEAPLKSVWHFRSPPASRASSSCGGVPAGNGLLRIFLQHTASTRHEQEKKHSAFLVVSLFIFI